MPKIPKSLWTPPLQSDFEFRLETEDDHELAAGIATKLRGSIMRDRGPRLPSTGAIYLRGERLGRMDKPLKRSRKTKLHPQGELVIDRPPAGPKDTTVTTTATAWDGRSFKLSGSSVNEAIAAATALAYLKEVAEDPQPITTTLLERNEAPPGYWDNPPPDAFHQDPLTGAFLPRKKTKAGGRRSKYLSTWNHEASLALNELEAWLSKGGGGRELLWASGRMRELRTLLTQFRNQRLPTILPTGQRAEDLLTGAPLPPRPPGKRGPIQEYLSVDTRRIAGRIKTLTSWLFHAADEKRGAGAQGQVWTPEAARAFKSRMFGIANKLNAVKVGKGAHPAAAGRWGGKKRDGEEGWIAARQDREAAAREERVAAEAAEAARQARLARRRELRRLKKTGGANKAPSVPYVVGDIIEVVAGFASAADPGDAERRVVAVTNKYADVKDGQSGWRGRLVVEGRFKGQGVWGWDDQVIRVVGGALTGQANRGWTGLIWRE